MTCGGESVRAVGEKLIERLSVREPGRSGLRKLDTTTKHRPIERWINLIYLIPFVAAVWFFARYSVDIPYMDQWNLPFLFHNVTAGRSVVPMLLTCNNEHPVLFPELIWIALAFITKWNTRVDMAVTLLSALVMFTAIARMATGEDPGKINKTKWTTAVSLFVVSLLVFSFVHYDDWLWGWQLTFVLANTCTVLAVYLLWASNRHPVRGQMLAWACCLVASFSALYGMLSWLVVIPTQFASIRNKRWATAAAAGSVLLLGASIAAYFLLLTRPFLYPVDRSFWHEHPIAALEFLCALVGGPLAQGNLISADALALFLGFALVALFVVSAVALMHAKRLASAAPWISIGLFGLGFATMTTLGRSAWGWGGVASLSRYMSVSVLLTIAALELCRQAMTARSVTFVALACVIGALSVAGSVASIPIARALKRDRAHAATYLEVERYIDPATDKYAESCLFPLFPVTPYTGRIRASVEELDALGFRKIARHVPFIDNPSKPYGIFELSTKDGQPSAVRDGDAVEAHGWAVIPDRDHLPKVVLISVGDARVFITAAWVGARTKPDLVRGAGTGQTAKAGWSVSIPATFLPRSESVLRAWVYDAEQQEFVRLGDLRGDNRVSKRP